MDKINFKCFFFCLLFSLGSLSAQEINVSGIVVDNEDSPLIGVSVTEKGTTNGTITDLEGKFSLYVKSQAILIFSYIGYVTQELPPTSLMNVKLSSTTLNLDEVVVIGYGSTNRRNLTSAVSHISSKDFLNINSINPIMQIQGKVAGVSITNTGAADPNAGANIQVRGVSSRSAGLGPLVVIDGVPGGDLYNLNSTDIESIDVLKDGAASAIYGTRGGNGVIIVTTKKGSADGLSKAHYEGYLSLDIIKDPLKSLSADEFREYRVAENNAKDYGANTDWFKAITQTGITQNHTVSFVGGNNNNNYRVSIDYRNAKGIDIRSQREEYGARMSLNHKSKNGLYQASLNIAPRVINRDNSDWEAFNQALLLNPTLPIKDPSDISGKKYFRALGDFASNVVETLDLELSGTEEKKLAWSANFRLNLLPVLLETPDHNLNTNVTIAQNINDSFSYFFRPASSTKSESSGFQGEASRDYSKSLQQSLEWLLDYQFSKNGHSASFVGGYSYQYFQNSSLSAENKNFTSDALTYNDLGDGSYQQVEGRNGFDSSKSDSKLIAFLGRATYDYEQKYLLSASLRYEGSSRFGLNNKWGAFPALSIGWRISQENFMESMSSWLNDLKIRTDFGVTGNQDFGNYKALSTYAGYGYVLYNGIYYRGWAPNKNPNHNLKWEKGVNWNVGLDFALFDKLTGSINYYNRTQKDLLGDYNVSTPPYLFSTLFTNVGTMKNTGIEIELAFNAFKNKTFSYDINFTGSTNSNKFTRFSNELYKGQEYSWVVTMPSPGSPGQIQQIREGQRIGTFVTWVYAGLDNEGNWLVYDDQDNVIPIKDAKEKDKRVTGNGLPRFTASMNHTFRYKNWDASIYLRGAFGFDLFNIHDFYYGLQSNAGGNNILKNAYTKNGVVKKGYNVLTDYFIEKGDYMKIDVLTLGYTLKPKSPWIESLRLYCTARNLATFTGFSGVDPESYPVNGLYPGIPTSGSAATKNYYPSTVQTLFGLQLTF